MSTGTIPRRSTLRAISHSEINTLLTCPARHDFRYVGQLAGDALQSKTTAPLLREGKAWGAAVAALHANNDLTYAQTILSMALEVDAQEQREQGVYLPDEHEATLSKLDTMLFHYQQTTQPLKVTEPERELLVAIPALNGHGKSSRYRFQAFIDGVVQGTSGLWLVEYKLRGQLTPLSIITLDRQIRWYAWAWREVTGTAPVGVIVDERLNDLPKPVKFNQNNTVSKVQSCTPEAYVAACQERNLPADEDVLSQLRQKRWSERHPVFFRPAEIDEAGVQLKSAARLVRQFDNGTLFPIRNPSRVTCPGCAFKDICAEPSDRELVDALFTRVPAKRDRVNGEVAA